MMPIVFIQAIVIPKAGDEYLASWRDAPSLPFYLAGLNPLRFLFDGGPSMIEY
jgi:hypothetical protein